MQNSLSQKDNEIDELKEELRQQREQSATELQEVQQQLTKHIQKIERKHNSTTQHWMVILLIVVMAGGIVNAYLYQTTIPSVEGVHETMNSLSSKIKKIYHNQHLREKELKESMNSLSYEVERISHNQHLIEKGLNESCATIAKFDSETQELSDKEAGAGSSL